MENHSTALILCVSLFFFVNLSLSYQNQLQTYMVYVKQPDIQISSTFDLESYYRSFLPIDLYDSDPQPRMIYAYSNVVTGFAARLSEKEVEAMSNHDGFLKAYLDRTYHLQTTRTPKFLGLRRRQGFWNQSNFGKGVIIGVLDTGIWPEHLSFHDHGVPPPPSRWKGTCEDFGSDFNSSNCNNKLIGARVFDNASHVYRRVSRGDSPRDTGGHGTHTASTAAGGFVRKANLFGNANGTAVGIAPFAHLAIYKVCDANGCAGADLLAGLDTAVKDGVDILSLSLGGSSHPFFNDVIAIGAFGAMEKGVFISCAAGNRGPDPFSTSNEAPWILTVGASTLDRTIKAIVKLGNSYQFNGQSLYQPKNFTSTLLPLVFPVKGSTTCEEGSLDGIDVKGKIVLCQTGGFSDKVSKGRVVLKAGGVAMILMNEEIDGFDTFADPHLLPASHVSYDDGIKIINYLRTTKNPLASLEFEGTIIEPRSLLAPAVASFSSRGPNNQSPGILKPDIIGPGVNILAAWPLTIGLDEDDERTAAFNMISGTSMATPHLTGIAALLKSSHPEWSPAVIKSAIMTTADVLNTQGKPIVDELHKPADLFSIGAGFANPSKANDPGLVYDIQPDDYIRYLCGLGYKDNDVEAITRRSVKCSRNTSIAEGELNYPSFAVAFKERESSQRFIRTVTNVGEANSSYRIEVKAPRGIEMKVEPKILSFMQVNEKMNYAVNFTRMAGSSSLVHSQGYLKWVSLNRRFVVRSPISVTFR